MPDPSVMSEAPFVGNPKLTEAGYRCCGKPRGCNMTHEGCAYLRHPWKRAMVFGDRTVRCQATATDPGTNEQWQCVLGHGHEGMCVRDA